MSLRYATAGNFTIDNVVTAEGNVSPRMMGGNAVYSAASVHFWEPDVGVISVIPANYPEKWLNALRKAGIDLTGVRKAADSVTVEEWFIYQPDGSRIDRLFTNYGRYAHLPHKLPTDEVKRLLQDLTMSKVDGITFGAFRKMNPITPTDIPKDAFPTRAVHISPNEYSIQLGLAQEFKKRGLIITLDPPFYPNGIAADMLEALFGTIDVFCPSQKELAAILPGLEIVDAIKHLIKMGPKAIAVKLGSQGVLVWDHVEREIRHIPAYPSKVVNLTGAGDAFCGGFLVGLCETGDPIAAANYGIVSASLMIESDGLLAAINHDRNRAIRRLSAYQALVSG